MVSNVKLENKGIIIKKLIHTFCTVYGCLLYFKVMI